MINKIVKLNEEEYEELVIDSIGPKWDKNIRGVHTFTNKNKVTVIDALIYIRRWFYN